MLECFGLLAGKREYFFDSGGVGYIPGHLAFWARTDLFLDFLTNRLKIKAHFLEHIHRNTLTQLDQAQQQMLGPHIVVVEPVCFLSGKG